MQCIQANNQSSRVTTERTISKYFFSLPALRRKKKRWKWSPLDLPKVLRRHRGSRAGIALHLSLTVRDTHGAMVPVVFDITLPPTLYFTAILSDFFGEVWKPFWFQSFQINVQRLKNRLCSGSASACGKLRHFLFRHGVMSSVLAARNSKKFHWFWKRIADVETNFHDCCLICILRNNCGFCHIWETKILALSKTSIVYIFWKMFSCWAQPDEAERTRSRSIWRTSGAVLGVELDIGTYLVCIACNTASNCMQPQNKRYQIFMKLSPWKFISVLSILLSFSWGWMWIILEGSTSVSKVMFPQPTWKDHNHWGESAPLA